MRYPPPASRARQAIDPATFGGGTEASKRRVHPAVLHASVERAANGAYNVFERMVATWQPRPRLLPNDHRGWLRVLPLRLYFIDSRVAARARKLLARHVAARRRGSILEARAPFALALVVVVAVGLRLRAIEVLSRDALGCVVFFELKARRAHPGRSKALAHEAGAR